MVSPQIVRSVSAICASFGSAGWQQVKISRRTSSCTSLSLASPSGNQLADTIIRHEFRSRSAGVWPESACGAAGDRSPCGVRHSPARRGDWRGRLRSAIGQRRGEGILHRIFRELEIAEQPDQRGQHAPALAAKQPAIGSGMRGALEASTGSISLERKRFLAPAAELAVHHDRPHLDRADRADGTLAAMPSASSKSLASTR